MKIKTLNLTTLKYQKRNIISNNEENPDIKVKKIIKKKVNDIEL